ncbi:MAG: hypothetical protein HOB40_02445 [Candidatus Marinimicrobia bacterium]|jgi:hypothetical protein|nr:hypothetical protein [Candidatus Neomarinimicrobiota bacterium]MBT3502087.1 hypothetical protein [Candidatus Neomarinimicrobiota bacterium]MBT3840470.1 hypothetical protein [Candidatus Neomarinimicrobiota bacterium]MBT3999976.1 hypothetical protein [Candidatus Neomarinimicrobiota bacterium]MBT4283511.1 hypothetical protein [Candidatus Neomarinimicrobiota bacterium]
MKILFELDHLYYLPQFEPIIAKLKTIGGHEIFGSINQSVPKIEKQLFIKEMGRLRLDLVHGNFEPQRRRIIKDMSFDLIFVGNKSSISAIKANNSFCIMVYHGIGLKQSYYSDLTKDIDLVCTESEARTNKLIELGYHAITTGFTKLDSLNNRLKNKNNIPEILYAPTYFPSSLQKTIPVLEKFQDYKVRIKLHHFYWTNLRYIKIRNILEERVKDLSFITISNFEQYNITPFYETADILITDYSSTLFEFLVLNKPIVQTTYSTLRFKYKIFPFLLKNRMDNDRISEVDFATLCDSPDLLLQLVQNGLDDDSKSSCSLRENARNQFLGSCDGQASSRVIKALNKSGIPIGVSD